MSKDCFSTSISCANSKLWRGCSVESEFPSIVGAFCTRNVVRFLQVFQKFRASSYEVTLGTTFVTSAFVAPCIWTFLHPMSILIAVVTQTRVFSCAFFYSTLAWQASYIPSFWRCHKYSDLAFFRADCFELNFVSFLEATVSFRLNSALKIRTLKKLELFFGPGSKVPFNCREPEYNSLMRWKNHKETIINHWWTRMAKDDFQSILRTLESLFAFFVFSHVRHH